MMDPIQGKYFNLIPDLLGAASGESTRPPGSNDLWPRGGALGLVVVGQGPAEESGQGPGQQVPLSATPSR